jgi:hypothetical protein
MVSISQHKIENIRYMGEFKFIATLKTLKELDKALEQASKEF